MYGSGHGKGEQASSQEIEHEKRGKGNGDARAEPGHMVGKEPGDLWKGREEVRSYRNSQIRTISYREREAFPCGTKKANRLEVGIEIPILWEARQFCPFLRHLFCCFTMFGIR